MPGQWTYAPGGLTAKDRVRDRIGDNNPNENAPASSGNPGRRQLDDAVILNYLVTENSEDGASVQCAQSLLTRYATEADAGARVGGGLEATRRFERLKDVLETLRYEWRRTAVISSPATDANYVQTSKLDETRLRPMAWIGMLDVDIALSALPEDGPWARLYWGW